MIDVGDNGLKKRVLVIQLRKLGDVILTTPVVDVLYERFEDVEIDFLTEVPYEEVLTGNPKLSNIFLLDKSSVRDQLRTLFRIRKRKYDYVFDFFGNPRSAWWAFFSGAKYRYGYDYPGRAKLYNRCVKRDIRPKYVVDFKMDLLKDFGIEAGYRKSSIYVGDDVKDRMRRFLVGQGYKDEDKILGLVTPNIRDVSLVKNWRIEGLVELARRVQTENNAWVLILWGPGEKELADEIKGMIKGDKVIMAPGMSIKELAGMISSCSVVVSGCCGSKHIAVAMDVPTVTIFGPTQEKSWNLRSERNIAVKAEELECLECDKTVCYKMDCMKLVSVDMVYDGVRKFL